MAEAIGVASGVITFIDAAKKVLSLCARIKDAPEQVAAYQQHLEDALFNVENLKQRLQSNANANISMPQQDVYYANNLLDRCTEHLRALQDILDSLGDHFKSGRRRCAWASLAAVRKSGEILKLFSKLQNGLDSLKFFLVQHNFWMLHSQSSAIAAVQTSLADLTSVQSSSMQGLEQSIAATSQRSTEYIIQELNHMFQSQTREIIPRLDAIYAVSARRLQTDLTSQIVAPTPTASQSQPLSVSGVRSVSARRCTCKLRPPSRYRTLGALYYQDRTKNVHESTCPLREKSEREIRLGLKMVIPTLFSKVVQLVISANFGAGGISISPAIKFPATVVDRKQSKGFQLLDSLILEYGENLPNYIAYDQSWETIKGLNHDALRKFCESVMARLFPLLEDGSVSAHDQDVTGATLLWGFFHAIRFENRIHEVDLWVHDHVFKVAEIMIKRFESDVNVTVGHSTILNLNVRTNFITRVGSNQELSSFCERLIQYGCELCPYPALSSFGDSTYDNNAMIWSFDNPDLAIDFGFPSHYQGIFNRSLDDLNKLIRKGTDWDRIGSAIPAAVSVCAFGWPDGLRRLLQVGVNPAPVFAGPLWWDVIHEDAIPVLISEGCPPFPQPIPGSLESVLPRGRSMFQLLHHGALENPEWILNYIVESRRQLAALGLKRLPHGSPERIQIETMQEEGCLLDKSALCVWEALKKQIDSLPESLFPGQRPSVYFWICYNGYHKSTWEFLFDSGFTDVNIKDQNGCTAFWKACVEKSFKFSDFLVSKGAEIHPGAHRMVTRTVWRTGKSVRALPDWSFDLGPRVTGDGCRCPCSCFGCTPANILAKDETLGHASRRILLSVYISRLRSDSREGSWLEACRLEMFERLGMTHTCCEEESKDFECTCNEVDADPTQDEYRVREKHLGYVLERNMLIYTKLRARFGGDVSNFLKAWWAAVDLFLPRDDTNDGWKKGSTAEAPNQWGVLPGLGKLHQSHSEFDEAKVWSVAQYYLAVVDSVTEFFNGLIDKFERRPVRPGPVYLDIKVALPEELSQYLSWLNVPLSTIKWLDGSKGLLENLDYEPSKYYWRVRDKGSIHSEQVKRDWMEDSIIPLVTAGVITDLNERRDIPESLYEHLKESEVIVDGNLRPLEYQENIFEQGMEFLGFS